MLIITYYSRYQDAYIIFSFCGLTHYSQYHHNVFICILLNIFNLIETFLLIYISYSHLHIIVNMHSCMVDKTEIYIGAGDPVGKIREAQQP